MLWISLAAASGTPVGQTVFVGGQTFHREKSRPTQYQARPHHELDIPQLLIDEAWYKIALYAFRTGPASLFHHLFVLINHMAADKDENIAE